MKWFWSIIAAVYHHFKNKNGQGKAMKVSPDSFLREAIWQQVSKFKVFIIFNKVVFLLELYRKETNSQECIKVVQSLIIIKQKYLNVQQINYDQTVKTKYYAGIKINHLARGGGWTRWIEQNKGFSYPGKNDKVIILKVYLKKC